MRRSGRVLTAAVLFAMSVVACGEGGDSTHASTSAPLTFYRPSTVLSAGAPGDVLSREPITITPDLHATGSKITFVSTTPAGDRVPVSGVSLTPTVAAPPGGYPVVVWAHGTTGVGDECAPSGHEPFGIAGAAPLLDAGDIVVAPDYEGLGISGEIHPYLVGEAAGHNVLDAARAARALGGSNVTVAWGWSQGGHAALWARALHSSYAPELDFRGVAAQAPVSDVGAFLQRGTTDPSVFPYTAEAILAWAEVYHETELTDLVVVEDAEKARLAQQACNGDIVDNTTKPLDQIFRSDPQNVGTWREAVRVNSVSAGRSPVPVLLTHGDADTIVPLEGTVALSRQLCESRAPTELLRNASWDHGTAWADTFDEVDAWIRGRIAGEPAPSNCDPPQ